IAPPRAAEGGNLLPRDSKARRHGAHQSVDRGPVLGAAGKINAAQPDRLLITIGLEYLCEQFAGHRLEAGDLLREAEDERAALNVGFLLYPLDEPIVEAADQRIEFARIGSDHAALLAALGENEGHAPDLLTGLATEIVEELDEASDQIEFGEKHI